jgi:hypothetical protein
VTSVRVRHDRASVPTLIEVFRTRGRPLQLHGFDGMADLASDLRTHIPHSANYVSKPQWAIASDAPAGRTSLVAGVMLSSFALNALLGRAVMNRAVGIMNIGIGVWMIIVRPIARANPNFRWLDFFVALMMLFGAWHALGSWPN